MEAEKPLEMENTANGQPDKKVEPGEVNTTDTPNQAGDAKTTDAAKELKRDPSTKEQPEENRAGPPKENRIEISIVWVNGRVAVKAPSNPIMIMKVLGQAMDTISNEFLDIARKAEAKAMFEPGPEVPYTQENKQVIAAANRELMGKRT